MPAASRSDGEGRAARRLLQDAERSAALDRIAALAARLLSAPSAQVSLLTDVQTVAGGAGLPPGAIGSRGPLEESLCTVTASLGAPLSVQDARNDDRVNELPPVVSGQVGAYLGVPLTSDAGEIVGALCVHGPDEHVWMPSDVVVLEHLAEFVRAELELAALARDLENNRARWELAVEAGDIGSFDWNLVTGELDWDDRLIAMYGYDVGDVAFDRSIASVEARVHPDDATLIADAMGAAIAAVGPLTVLYRIVLPGGRIRWLEARGRALAGPDGTANRLIGVSWDVTDVRDNDARAERVLAGMTVGYLVMDEAWRISYVNAEGSRLLGVDLAGLNGATIWEAFPSTVGTEFEATYRRVAATGTPETFEMFYPAPLNAWYEIRVSPEARGIALYFLDVTERRRNLDLVRLSVDVSEHMVGAASVEAAVAALASMVVPALADWSIVTLVDADGSTRDVQTWHADEALRPTVDRYVELRPTGGGTGAVGEVVGKRVSVRVDAADIAEAARRLPTDEGRATLATLAAETAVVVPMLAGDSGDVVAGILTLCRGADREPMTDQELAVTESLCRRAGLAIDNARLYAAQSARAEHDRTVAEALQQALLTRLPHQDRLQLVARYLTAADGDQVGGDWYDALAGPDGTATLMIGDVVGHDITAAASMGQLRTMLRMLALRPDDAPSQMLEGLDQAARDLGVRTLATVVAARIEPAEAGGAMLRWSNAGHPAPIVVHTDGTTEILDAGRPELLLGVQAGLTRTDHTHALPAGSTLLLYTDGLIESRTADIDIGTDVLCAALTRHHALDVDTMLDRVLADTVGDRPADDVAVLAVRLDR